MDNSKLKEIIKQEIYAHALEFVKDRESYIKSNQKSDLDMAIENQSVDDILFYGGESSEDFELSRRRALRESEEMAPEPSNMVGGEPQITRSEVDEFEQKFKEVVSPMVKFNSNEEGEIDYQLYKGESGIEASIGGTIPLQAENYIKFNFSLQNGPFMSAKVELTTDTAEIISNLASFYEQWKRDWGQKLGNLK